MSSIVKSTSPSCADASRCSTVLVDPHGDIQRHGVFKCRLGGDIARQRAIVILLVVALRQFDDACTGIEEQLFAIGVGRQQRAVARLRQAQCFGQAVHRVGGEHTGTGTAGRTGGALDLIAVGVADVGVGPWIIASTRSSLMI